MIERVCKGLNLGLHPVNERRRDKVTPSLIGWVQTYTESALCLHYVVFNINRAISNHHIPLSVIIVLTESYLGTYTALITINHIQTCF